MDQQDEDLTDRLRPLLLEARNMLNLQHRACKAGIRVEHTFIQARIDRWEAALSTMRESHGARAYLGEAKPDDHLER